MDRRSNPANALGKEPDLAGIAAPHDILDPPPHLSGRPGLGNRAVFHFAFNAKMAFDPRDGINNYSLRHSSSCSVLQDLPQRKERRK